MEVGWNGNGRVHNSGGRRFRGPITALLCAGGRPVGDRLEAQTATFGSDLIPAAYMYMPANYTCESTFLKHHPGIHSAPPVNPGHWAIGCSRVSRRFGEATSQGPASSLPNTPNLSSSAPPPPHGITKVRVPCLSNRLCRHVSIVSCDGPRSP